MKVLRTLATITAAAVSALTMASANASLIWKGVTYDLTQVVLSATVSEFTLTITGINGPSDTEGGRYGVESLAFYKPAHYAGASLPGFTTLDGGLNAGGCNGTGAEWFCFDGPTPAGPALAANSTLSFTFTETISSGSWYTTPYDTHLKINWIGTKNNYDLVSQPIRISDCDGCDFFIPEPPSLALFALALLAVGGFAGLRRGRGM